MDADEEAALESSETAKEMRSETPRSDTPK
jgi:hypothetical protein